VKLNLVGVVSLSVGIILIYAAIKGIDPRDIVKAAFGDKEAQDRLKGPATTKPGNPKGNAPKQKSPSPLDEPNPNEWKNPDGSGTI